MQIARNFLKTRGSHGDRRFSPCSVDTGCEDRVRELRLQAIKQRFHSFCSEMRFILRTPFLVESFPAISIIHRATLPDGVDSPAHIHLPGLSVPRPGPLHNYYSDYPTWRRSP